MLATSFSVQEIQPKDYLQVRDLVAETPFLARKSWNRPLSEIALDGITCAEWTPLGIFVDDRLVSYLDYKLRRGQVEVGIFVTDMNHRGQGMATALLEYLFEMYPASLFKSNVAVANQQAMRLLRGLGFHTDHYNLADRVDGTDTAVLVKQGGKF